MSKKPTYEKLESRVEQLEFELNDSRKIIETIVDAVPVRIFWKDLELKYLGCNKLFAKDAGFDVPEDLIGKDDYQMGWENQVELYRNDDLEVIQNRKPKLLIEEPQTAPNGETITLLTSKVPLYNDKNEPSGVLGTYTDITEWKEKETEYSQLFSMSLDLICIADINTSTFLKVNPAFQDILGYSEKELLNKPFSEFIHPDDIESTQAIVEEKLRQGSQVINFENRYRCKNGSYKWLSWASHPNPEQGKTFAIARDITDQKQMEKERDENEKKYRSLFYNAQVALFKTSIDGQILEINRRYAEIAGYKNTEECMAQYRPQTAWKDPESRNEFLKRIQKTGSVGDYEAQIVRKDGTDAWILFSATVYPNQGSIEGSIVDITERKKLESQVRQAQKMESIGNLAGGIAHDFNNLLSPIIGYAEMLKEDLPKGSHEHESAQEIFNAGKRGGELVKQILAFSQQVDQKLSPVRFQEILTEVFKLTRSTIPSDIEIHQDIQKDCGVVMAEETQLHQIGMNLITNAYHAVEQTSGEISVQLKEVMLDNDDLKDSPLQAGHYVMLSVSDNGVGIPQELMNNIFEPYFTTKEKGKGTGLGLAVVYGILKEHNGDIKVYSEVGKGTTFNVYLPLIKKSTKSISIEKKLNKLTGTERLLLVDDEESIVQLEKQILERLGYKVSALSNSLDALETFHSNPEGYDLVISDMTMPNMTGDQLARELMSIRPDIPIIICTGFSEKINKELAESIGVKGFLVKPVLKSDMAKMIRNVLDATKNLDGF